MTDIPTDFTPGPWSVTDNSWEVSTVYGADGNPVAQCHIDGDVTEETETAFVAVKEANARLIALAPDMAAEIGRLRAEVGRLKPLADDWTVMRDERDMAKCNYDNLLDDTNGEIAGLRHEVEKRGRQFEDYANRVNDDLKTILEDCKALRALNAELVEGLKKLRLAYVHLMEAGRDRIMDLGGNCDQLDVMEAGDPSLREARALLSKAEERT